MDICYSANENMTIYSPNAKQTIDTCKVQVVTDKVFCHIFYVNSNTSAQPTVKTKNPRQQLLLKFLNFPSELIKLKGPIKFK